MSQPPLIWDSHACLPLHPDIDFAVLDRHRRAGVSYVSINVGMDMNPIDQVMRVLASFDAQLRARPDLFVAVDRIDDVRRAHADGKLAVAFDLEGALPLLGRPEMVAVFRRLGVRQIHFAYNRNNAIAGGCYDEPQGLSELGRRMLQAVNSADMLMDCSHTGHRSSLEIIDLSASPVIFSHANPRALQGNLRNITDEQIDACAARGGVVCVNGVGRFLRDVGASTGAILDCIDYLTDRIGIDRVGLGIDYEYPAGRLDDSPPGLDRGYWWPAAGGYGPDGIQGTRIAAPEQFPEIVEGLDRRGYDEAGRARILGFNMLDLAGRVWNDH